MWILIVLLIVVLIILLWQLSNMVSVFSGSLYVKTNHKVIHKALKLANVKKDNVFYDLGCGNGNVLIEASKLGAKCIGYEISPYYYILSKLRTLRFKNVEVEYQNIRDINLSQADVIYCYLLPKLISQINFSKTKKDTKIISIGFPIKNFKLLKKIKIENHFIFIYQ